MTLGTPVYDDLARYAAANTLTRTLASKIAPETLSRLKQAPLLYLSGSCREKESALERLPMPTLIHFELSQRRLRQRVPRPSAAPSLFRNSRRTTHLFFARPRHGALDLALHQPHLVVR